MVMPTPAPFLDAKPLGSVIKQLSELPKWTWLYISNSESRVTLTTKCSQTAVDSRQMSEQEIDDIESSAVLAGLKCFLSREQLEDIIGNLGQQEPQFTAEQLAAAVDYNWRHDAFVDLSKHPA